MPRHQGIWRQQWSRCDRCGFEHPVGMLTRQLGLLVCKDHGCIDDLTNQRRAIVIEEVLSDGQEGVNELAEQLDSDDGNDLEF